jgi:hypothetical protein
MGGKLPIAGTPHGPESDPTYKWDGKKGGENRIAKSTLRLSPA